MTTAVIWCLATGALWTGVGIYFSAINRQGRDPILFNLCSAVFLLALCLGTVRWSGLLAGDCDHFELIKLLVVMILAGGALAGGMVLMIVAMRRGLPDVAWSICQSSMVVPFALGVLLNGERASVVNVLGMVAILAGITVFGRRKKAAGAGQRWFALSLGAFAVIGAGQYFFSLPSYWPGWSDRYALRIPMQAAGGLAFLLVLARPGKLLELDRIAWLHGALFAVLTFAGRFALYQAIDALAALRLVAIAYPVCLGLSILGFVFYHALCQRRLSLAAVAVSALLVAGLLMLGYR